MKDCEFEKSDLIKKCGSVIFQAQISHIDSYYEFSEEIYEGHCLHKLIFMLL